MVTNERVAGQVDRYGTPHPDHNNLSETSCNIGVVFCLSVAVDNLQLVCVQTVPFATRDSGCMLE